MLKFRDYLEEHSGISFENEKLDSLRLSIHTRATRLKFSSYEDYFDYLKANEDEFKNLLSLNTVNETYFFRYPEQFKIFKDYVLPEIIRENKNRTFKSLKIWSAGCSTGEEPYTIAIIVSEVIKDLSSWDIHILGTDVSAVALEKAIKGRFAKSSFRITEEEFKQKYFKKVGDNTWEIIPEVKKLVNFSYHNLIKEPYPLAFMELWDVIFCRNVTIYFRQESTRRVVANLYKSLKPGGFLFTGHTETLYHINPGFEVIKFGDAFIFRKPEEKKKAIQVEKSLKMEKSFIDEKPEHELIKSNLPEIIEEIVEVIDEEREEDSKEGLEFYQKTAYRLLDEGNPEAALKLLKKAIKRFSKDPELYYLEGIAYKKLELYTHAEESFKKAVYLSKDHYLALIELASLHTQKGEYEKAVNHYRAAINSLNSMAENADSNNEERELLIRICEMMIQDIQHKGAM